MDKKSRNGALTLGGVVIYILTQVGHLSAARDVMGAIAAMPSLGILVLQLLAIGLFSYGVSASFFGSIESIKKAKSDREARLKWDMSGKQILYYLLYDSVACGDIKYNDYESAAAILQAAIGGGKIAGMGLRNGELVPMEKSDKVTTVSERGDLRAVFVKEKFHGLLFRSHDVQKLWPLKEGTHKRQWVQR